MEILLSRSVYFVKNNRQHEQNINDVRVLCSQEKNERGIIITNAWAWVGRCGRHAEQIYLRRRALLWHVAWVVQVLDKWIPVTLQGSPLRCRSNIRGKVIRKAHLSRPVRFQIGFREQYTHSDFPPPELFPESAMNTGCFKCTIPLQSCK